MIKLREGNVKSNVNELKEELEDYYRSRLKSIDFDSRDIVEKRYFSIDHPKTKEAGNFVKEINEKRKMEKEQF